MAVKIFWTDFAKDELRNIFDYYKVEASRRFARNLVEEIVAKTNILEVQPDIGQKEVLLTERPEEFRYLVHKNYKIIYWFNKAKNRVEISDVFDARQNPAKIKREK